MRSLVLCLLLCPSVIAQSVFTLGLNQPIGVDGIYTSEDGRLFAAGGYLGTALFEIGEGGGVAELADGIGGPIDLVLASDGSIYTTDFNQGEVSRIGADGQVTVLASVPDGPADVVQGPDGALYVAHYGDPNGFGDGDSVSRITLAGDVEPYVSGGTISAPVGLAFDGDGNLYVAGLFDGRITRVAPDGSQTLFASLPERGPFTIGHLAWANGLLYATYVGGHQVIAFAPDGSSRVVAGTGTAGQADGPTSTATLLRPNGIAASVTGDTLYVASTGTVDRIRLITSVRATALAPPLAPSPALRFRGATPNPFVGSTRLGYEIAEPGPVTLSALDVLGREVARLVEAEQPAGHHEIDWIPEALAPGTYLLRLQAGGTAEVRRVTYGG